MDMKKITLLIVCSLLYCSGCTWGLKHRNMRVKSSVAVRDLTSEVAGIAAGIQFFDSSPSTDRFPAGIGVVRLANILHEYTSAPKLTIFPLRGYEAPYWNELFDGTSEVRSVFAIHEKSVRDKYVTIEELWRAADVGSAGLLLVYGYDNASEKDVCQIVGLLYEIPSGTLLAGIKNIATIDDARAQAQNLPRYKRPSTYEDWAFYVDHVAFRGFEKKVKRCVWEMIDRDQASGELRDNPFKDPAPLYRRSASR